MNFLEKTDDEIIEYLADGNDWARDLLGQVPADKFRALAFDLADMEMRAQQIATAFIWSGYDYDAFFKGCAERSAEMIDFVNRDVTDRIARRGAPQTTAPKVDAAVKAVLDEAQARGDLVKLDEIAEHVNKFFIVMMGQMQKYKDFSSNLRINVAGLVPGASFAQFRVTMMGLVDTDGKLLSIEQQPTAENQRINEELAKQAVEEGAKEFLGGMGEVETPVASEVKPIDMSDMLTRVSYILAAHEEVMRRITHPDFKDAFSEWRWSFAVTLKEIGELVDKMIATGTEITPEQVTDFKEGRAFIRMNDVRIVPELEDMLPQLNG